MGISIYLLKFVKKKHQYLVMIEGTIEKQSNAKLTNGFFVPFAIYECKICFEAIYSIVYLLPAS
jgi:hypothetical protein